MAERAANVANPASCRESVCIHTIKIFDICKDKDCIEDLRLYPTCGSQAVVDTAFSIRPNSAKLLYADVRVEDLNFNRGCFTVDITYFYKVTGRSLPRRPFGNRPCGFRQESGSKVFTSHNGGLCENIYKRRVSENVSEAY